MTITTRAFSLVDQSALPTFSWNPKPHLAVILMFKVDWTVQAWQTDLCCWPVLRFISQPTSWVSHVLSGMWGSCGRWCVQTRYLWQVTRRRNQTAFAGVGRFIMLKTRACHFCLTEPLMLLTYWCLDKMATTLQKTFSNIFLYGNNCILIQILIQLFLRLVFTICQHWLR